MMDRVLLVNYVNNNSDYYDNNNNSDVPIVLPEGPRIGVTMILI